MKRAQMWHRARSEQGEMVRMDTAGGARRRAARRVGVATALGVWLALSLPAGAAPIAVRAGLGQPVVVAGPGQRAWLRVGLRGLQGEGERAPLNVAIVLDKSSSMAGQKMREARRAAMETVRRLSPRDIVSVITYDSVVEVVVPATRATDRGAIMRAIAGVQPGGYTALFAGVSKGAAELRKFLSPGRVNRMLLLSDGLANRGPSSPGELGSLGSSLGSEGISVSTIGLGLGYNEDLMSRLAAASDGNHAFVEEASDLARIFDLEFGDLVSVVAQGVEVIIDCEPGVRPLRVMGRDAWISGRRVRTQLRQVYGGQEKYVLLEVQLPAMAAGLNRSVASVRVEYSGIEGSARRSATARVGVLASDDEDEIARRTDPDVMVAAAEMLANERNKLALSLRDAGKQQQARAILEANTSYLDKQAQRYKSKRLYELKDMNENNAENLDGDRWRRTRKQMRKAQHRFDNQQSY